MDLWEYTVLILAVLLGGYSGLIFKDYRQSVMSMALTFTGSYLIGIIVMVLLPAVYTDAHSVKELGLWMLGGFFFQIFLESLSKGVEHGHIHVQHSPGKFYVLQVFLGLSFHALVEGLPLSGFGALVHDHSEHSLLWGIIIHKAPAAFALSLLLTAVNYPKWKVILLLVLFSLMTPLGGWIGQYWQGDVMMIRRFMAVLVGVFFHVSTLLLFENESNRSHGFSLRKLVLIVLGLGLAILGS